MSLAASQPLSKGSVVLSMHELHHIKTLTQPLSQQRDPQAARKQILQERSKGRYQNWGNTIDALREKKKKDRLRRLQEIEAAQQLVDHQEAEFNEDQRRQAIDRANRLMFNDSDRVKELHSGALLSTVMKERTAQIALNRLKKQQEARLDTMWSEVEARQMEEQAQREAAAEAHRKAKSHEMARLQMEQLAMNRERHRLEREEEIREAERIRQAALEAAEEMREAERKKVERARLASIEFAQTNTEQQRIKAEVRRLEAEEEARVEAFAKEKERIQQLRKQRTEERQRQKMNAYEGIIRRQFEYLQRIRSEEASREERQFQEVETKAQERMALDENKRKKMLEDMKHSRARQLQMKAEERQRIRTEENMLMEQWQRRTKEMEEKEAELDRRTTDKAKQLQGFLKHQMTSKGEAKTREKARELDEARQLELAKQHEDAMFEEYARAHILAAQAAGKVSTPLELVLHSQEQRQRH